MLDIGWTELLVIGIVALIVVGPKDLPALFRKLGQFTARARGMAREFQRAMEAAADDSGIKDVARDLKESASGKDMGLDEFRDIAKGPKSWAKDKVMGRKGARAPDDAGEAAADAADAADDVAGDTATGAGPEGTKPAARAGEGTASKAAAASRPASKPAGTSRTATTRATATGSGAGKASAARKPAAGTAKKSAAATAAKGAGARTAGAKTAKTAKSTPAARGTARPGDE